MIKSSHHSKVTGDFAEHLVQYWLSKSGFECARVDYFGIDLIAKKDGDNKIMGISVKSRSRNIGKGKTSVKIPYDAFEKADQACAYFRCKPFFAIVVDRNDEILIFMASKKEIEDLYGKISKSVSWSMSDKWIKKYEESSIKIVRLNHENKRWW